MANYFNLTLDTIGPQDVTLQIAGGSAYTATQLVELTIGTSDADVTDYTMRIWGQVDTTYDADIQDTEVASAWISYVTSKQVKLAELDLVGVAQVETAVISGTVTGDGNIDVVVTAAGMTGSPKTVQVAVLTSDTASDVAGKIRTALGLEANITDRFTITGAGANVILTRNISAADDNTLNIAVSANALGVDTLVSSTDTTAGRAPDANANRTVYIKVRDDVWNVSSEVSDMITLDTVLPVVTIMSGPIPTKISKIATKDTAEFVFQVSEIYDEYKVKVVSASGAAHTTGTVIPTTAGSTYMGGTAGSYPATTNVTCTIKGADLETASSGDGVKIVKVFVKDRAGNWSA